MVVNGTKPSAIQEIVSLNNYGVQLLGNGNLVGARQVFYIATDQMEEALKDQERHVLSTSDANLLRHFSELSTKGGLYFVAPDNMMIHGAQEHPGRSNTYPPGSDAGLPVRDVPQCQDSAVINSQDQSSSGADEYSDGRRKQQRRRSFSSPDRANASTMAQSDPRNQLSQDYTGMFSFLRPILIRPDDFIQSQNPPLMQLCTCLLFNLAVTSHTMALVSPPSSAPSYESRAWTEAIYLYRLAYNLQVDARMEISRLHTLGMVNNLGQLYSFAGEIGRSKECFQVLLNMISVDSARMKANLRADVHYEESLQGPYVQLFLDNIFGLFMCHGLLCHSPAA